MMIYLLCALAVDLFYKVNPKYKKVIDDKQKNRIKKTFQV